MSPAHNNLPAESDERSAVDIAVDCYSESEQRSMEYGQRLRGVLLNPLLQWLSAMPAFSGCGHTFRPAVGTHLCTTVSDGKRVASLICLSMHVMLDGLDGPLARCQDVVSPRGSFTDTFADQPMVTGSIFVFIYAPVVATAMVRNALSIPYSWLIRPRFLVFSAVTADLLFA